MHIFKHSFPSAVVAESGFVWIFLVSKREYLHECQAKIGSLRHLVGGLYTSDLPKKPRNNKT